MSTPDRSGDGSDETPRASAGGGKGEASSPAGGLPLDESSSDQPAPSSALRRTGPPPLPPSSRSPAPPLVSAPPVAEARPRWPLFALAAVFAGALVGGAIALVQRVKAPPVAASAAPAPPSSPPAEAASAAAPRTIQAVPLPEAETNACIASHFAPGSFAPPKLPPFSSLCAERDAKRGAGVLKSAIEGSGAPAGKQEWAALAWYELAAFAVARASCCPLAEPLLPAAATADCEGLDRILGDLAAASTAGNDVSPVLVRYRAAAACLHAKGKAGDYPYRAPPGDEAEAAFKKTLARVPR